MSLTPDWTQREVDPKQFKDLRHAKRLGEVLRVLEKQPPASVPVAAGNAAASQAIYRFWSNPRVKAAEILNSHREGVKARARECDVVLAIQDTTDLEYGGREQRKSLGYINQSEQKGIKVHSSLAVSGEGEPLGLLNQESWSREERSGKREQRRKKPVAAKESKRWLEAAAIAERELPESVTVVHIGDREADIFELFAQPRCENGQLLIRAGQNRRVKEELGTLMPTLEQAPIMGERQIEIRRNPQRQARSARVQMRALSITLEVPRNHPKPHELKPVVLNGILVEEIGQPEDKSKPIRWVLLTSLPIETAEAAWQCVEWYTLRWLIERYHYTLKSGCSIEALQLQSQERLIKALATYSIIAWRLMWLTYKARLTPEAPCTEILEEVEWRLLRRKYAPKNRTKKPPTLQQALSWIARLGGFLARKSDGDPGVKTLWRGLMKLRQLQEGAQLAAES